MEWLFGKKINFIQGALAVISATGFPALFFMAAFYAPVEKQMGIVQKIFYIHVPMAWTSFLAFLLVCLFSIMFLWKKSPAWDIAAGASAEAGLVLCTMVLATGMLWGKASWGIWWTWDVRLTTTLILWLIYIGYLVLRASARGGDRMQRFAAVYGIIGFLDVPLVYLSVKKMSSIHPLVIKGGKIDLADPMKHTLFFSLFIFSCFFAFLLITVIRHEYLRLRTERLCKLKEEEDI